VDEYDPTHKPELLAKTPLFADDTFASVNDYYEGFNQDNPENIHHLVTLVVNPGDSQTFIYIEPIVLKIGKLVHRDQGSGAEHHRITALVQTKLRIIPELRQSTNRLPKTGAGKTGAGKTEAETTGAATTSDNSPSTLPLTKT
jgi:hypothetical protein